MEKPTLPDEDIARLMRFYDVETRDELIAAQLHHIERLQSTTARIQTITALQQRPVRIG